MNYELDDSESDPDEDKGSDVISFKIFFFFSLAWYMISSNLLEKSVIDSKSIYFRLILNNL